MKDVIIIGGGLAGLSAAWRLKNHDILLLESENRVGGRVMSERRGNYWMNWGGHVYAGKGSATDELLKSVGVKSLPVPGKLSAMHLNGKLLLNGRVELYPFRVPMSWKARLSLLKAGAKVRAAVIKYGKVEKQLEHEDYSVRQQRILDFMNNKTFTDFTGELPLDADAIFRPTVSRSTGEPEQISAGAGIGYFHMIWNKAGGLSQNIMGGPSTLTNTIACHLKKQIELNAQVSEVIKNKDFVTVRYKIGDTEYTETAKYVILATPAPITQKITKNLSPKLEYALKQIKYGPHVSASFLTNETNKQVWDDIYAFATPKKSFDILIHNSNVVHALHNKREQGSSFMTFSPANRGKDLIEKSEEEILEIYLNDLEEMFPGFKDLVVEAKVNKFPYGSAYVYPGRGQIQSTLTEPDGRLFLAGDYLGTFYTETAIQTGFTAAQNINSLLGFNKVEEMQNIL
ncbi:FAD-dependent oxidoreductase [Staphylococcus sp. ACRSN]|uniref:protoporphyrinogen/coproporphyrinogen oxidase n=1 Tax=Staphylococcus sp. ACRSN TaxID=2918214 RepID=UPI001EF27EF0|nr:NAD(P)/FAD-dependent oxidoreductase [Staphylococcus sp. ACRSN]MCG7339269.1 FAD-dependent oxidoreductase [Staphylococcus sp. ACRSN]